MHPHPSHSPQRSSFLPSILITRILINTSHVSPRAKKYASKTTEERAADRNRRMRMEIHCPKNSSHLRAAAAAAAAAASAFPLPSRSLPWLPTISMSAVATIASWLPTVLEVARLAYIAQRNSWDSLWLTELPARATPESQFKERFLVS